MKVTLAGLIKARREARGLSQAELGREVGLSAAQISRIESDADVDRWDPHWSTMIRFAVALDLSLDEVARTTASAAPKRRGQIAGMGALVLVEQSRIARIERDLERLHARLPEAAPQQRRRQAAQGPGRRGSQS